MKSTTITILLFMLIGFIGVFLAVHTQDYRHFICVLISCVGICMVGEK